MMMRPTVIDLFSGAGGMSLGAELAGFDVLLGVDNDPVHAATHHFNFPQGEVLAGSVASFSGQELARRSGLGQNEGPDLVVGGPPCQGFSLIGRRLVDDPRNQLLAHFGRLVTELQPKYFVMENVPGMLVGDHTSVLEALISMIEAGGRFKTALPTIMNAADYGVPQDRRRVILMGWRSDQDPVEIPTQTHGRAVADERLPWVTVGEALKGLPELALLKAPRSGHATRLSPEQLEAIEREARRSQYVNYLRGGRTFQGRDARGYWDNSILADMAATTHTPRTVARYEVLGPGETDPKHRLRRLDPRSVCNTLRAGSGRDHGAHTSPRPIHPTEPRVITVREAARLHSFPDWFQLHRTKWHGFRQIGNAVPPLLGLAILAPIAERLGVRKGTIGPTEPTWSDETLLTLTIEDAALRLNAVADDVPVNVRRGRRR